MKHLPLFECSLFFLLSCGCSHEAPRQKESAPVSITSDFSTPEGAILKIEDGYRAKDIEAAVACKAFLVEASMMFQDLKKSPATPDDDV